MNRPYSEATAALIAERLPGAIATACPTLVDLEPYEWGFAAQLIADALAEAGLLLPEGAETRTEYGVQHSYPGDEPITIPATNHLMAAQAVARSSGRRLALMERNTWSSPWVEVDAGRLAVGDSKRSVQDPSVSVEETPRGL